MPATERREVCFGQYQVDVQTGELRTTQGKIKLQGKPFQILAILLERPGKLVTREELRQRLWPGDTFVDFEHGINVAMKKLREALGDSADEPEFIETLPRRGYRFIAPLVNDSPALSPVGHREAQLTDSALSQDAGNAARAERPHEPVAAFHSGQALNAVKWAPLRGGGIIVAAAGAVVLVAGIVFILNLGGLRDRIRASVLAQGAAPLPKIDSLAVLPLENLSRDPEQEYFADGLTDALITDLGQIVTLRVISRTSSMGYKRGRKPLPEIARELNVDAAVEGTVQRLGNSVRIRAQLVEARTDRHLWAESYERGTEDLAGLEEAVALAIAHEVSGRLTAAQEARLASKRAVNPRAYDAYLRGRYLWNERESGKAEGARVHFEEALKEEPNFALAYSGLADYWSTSWGPWEDQPLAEKYARKAIALEPDLAEGHASLGLTSVYQCKFTEADKELRRAIELNPNYAMAHHWCSLFLAYVGRPPEALAENDRARELDPFSLPVNFLRGAILAQLHHYDQAVAQEKTAVALNPQSANPHVSLANIYWVEGRILEALTEEREVATLTDNSVRLRELDEIAAAYAKSGVPAARVKAAEISERGYCGHQPKPADLKPGCHSAYDVAAQYGLLGDKEKTLSWLEQGLRDGPKSDFAGEVDYDLVRSEPRFQALLRRMNIPP